MNHDHWLYFASYWDDDFEELERHVSLSSKIYSPGPRTDEQVIAGVAFSISRPEIRSGFMRAALDFDPAQFWSYSEDHIRLGTTRYARSLIWRDVDKIEALHERHDKAWNQHLIRLSYLMIDHYVRERMADGEILHSELSAITSHGGGMVARQIAGADWLESEAGKAVIARAGELNRGTEAEIIVRLRNRIAMLDRLVEESDTLDSWPPALGLRQTSHELFYRSRFVPEAEQEPQSSVWISRNVQDESALQVFLADSEGVRSAEPRGSFWLADGATATLYAFDAADNARKLILRNAGGVIEETESTGAVSEFSGELGSAYGEGDPPEPIGTTPPDEIESEGQ